MSNIQVDPNIFNKVYSHIKACLKDESIRYITIYGGSSSSKSYSIIQAILLFCMLEEGSNTLVMRKYGADIRDSVYADMKSQLYELGLGDLFTPQVNLIKCQNGSETRFRGLDDSEKIKGIATFKRLFFEEITQFDYEDLKQARKRLRGKSGQQIIMAFNPIDEDHWIKKNFIDSYQWKDMPCDLDENSFIKKNREGNAVLIKTTYLDNYWVMGDHPTRGFGYRDKHTIDDFEHDRNNDYEYYRIYALGEFGRMSTGAEIYKNFNATRHLLKSEVDTEKPLLMSVDENVLPYITMTLWQGDKEKGDLWQVGQILARPPMNTLRIMVNQFIKQYPNRFTPIVITGDRTSKKADVKLEKGKNFFQLIEDQLKAHGYTNVRTRLPNKNPNVASRVAFMNAVFSSDPRTRGINVYLHPKCAETISDVSYCPENMDGTKMKTRIKDPKTKQIYEKWGHCSDTMDYVACQFFNEEFNLYLYGGKRDIVKTYHRPNTKAY